MPFRRKLLVLDKAHQLLVDLNKVIPGIRRALPREEGTDLANRAEEVAKMIQGLIRRIRRDLGDDETLEEHGES